MSTDLQLELFAAASTPLKLSFSDRHEEMHTPMYGGLSDVSADDAMDTRASVSSVGFMSPSGTNLTSVSVQNVPF